MPYKIVRFVFNNGETQKEIIEDDLSLEEAQDHCNDKESSSRTCTSQEVMQRTDRIGPWFDVYEEE